MKSAESGCLAASHNDIRDGGRWAMPPQAEYKKPQAQYRNAYLPRKAAKSHRSHGAADMHTRPVSRAERAQAELFEAILEDEFSRLMGLANRMTGPLDWLKHPDTGGAQSPGELVQIHTRIDEVRRLLDALQDRFLHFRFDRER